MADDIENGPEGHARGGIQALDAAMAVLHAFAAAGGPVGVTELARAAGMPVSKVHRYLASFVHAGLAVQDGRSGRYGLGAFAARIGLMALARSDLVNRAADRLEDLCLDTGLTALLTVWGNNGATVLRWQRAASPMVTSFGLGSTLPVLTSASGRIFLAFLPRRLTAAAVSAEAGRAIAAGAAWPDLEPTEAGVAALVRRVRTARMAAVDGRYVPGLRAISAPVLNWQEEAEAAVTLIGTGEDILPEGSAARRALEAFAAAASVTAAGARR
jgi:DNA-binding IclR family transcriptional regulator